MIPQTFNVTEQSLHAQPTIPNPPEVCSPQLGDILYEIAARALQPSPADSLQPERRFTLMSQAQPAVEANPITRMLERFKRLGRNKDVSGAFDFFLDCARAGDEDAMPAISRCFQEGLKTPKDPEKAFFIISERQK